MPNQARDFVLLFSTNLEAETERYHDKIKLQRTSPQISTKPPIIVMVEPDYKWNNIKSSDRSTHHVFQKTKTK